MKRYRNILFKAVWVLGFVWAVDTGHFLAYIGVSALFSCVVYVVSDWKNIKAMLQ